MRDIDELLDEAGEDHGCIEVAEVLEAVRRDDDGHGD